MVFICLLIDFGRGEEEEGSKGKVKEEKPDKPVKRKKVKDEDKTAAADDTAGPASSTKNNTPGGKKPKKSGAAAAAASAPASAQPTKKRAARKADRERSASPPELANVEIDPDEPTYCLCDQVRVKIWNLVFKRLNWILDIGNPS